VPKTTIITAIYDDYDTLKPVCKQSIDVNWICVTDDYDKYLNTLEGGDYGWNIIYEPRPHLHPNRAAKLPKCLPWLYTDTGSSIWIDASYQVVSPTFAEDVLHYADPIAQFSHPWRQCVYDEVAESMLLPKYANEREWLGVQEATLKLKNFPAKWGLWATGVIARHHTNGVIQSGFDWLAELYKFSYQDQISHPEVMWRNELRPVNLPGTHLHNEWLSYQGSGRH
jgi:hypothetical protein